VDSEDGPGFFKKCSAPVKCYEIKGDEGCLPVVAVEDIEYQIEFPAYFKNAFTEKDETRVIIWIISHGVAIHFVSAKIFVIRDEINSAVSLITPLLFPGSINSAFLCNLPDRDIDLRTCIDERSTKMLRGHFVKRKKERGIDAHSVVFPEKSSGNISQPSCF
jgi:hypothetical protein